MPEPEAQERVEEPRINPHHVVVEAHVHRVRLGCAGPEGLDRGWPGRIALGQPHETDAVVDAGHRLHEGEIGFIGCVDPQIVAIDSRAGEHVGNEQPEIAPPPGRRHADNPVAILHSTEVRHCADVCR
jgi:hypothetical protein